MTLKRKKLEDTTLKTDRDFSNIKMYGRKTTSPQVDYYFDPALLRNSVEYAAGTFTVEPTFVTNGGNVYYLDTSHASVTLPYTSSNLATEYASGHWVKLNITRDELDAINGANSPSSTNVFATMDDIGEAALSADEVAAIQNAGEKDSPDSANPFVTQADLEYILLDDNSHGVTLKSGFKYELDSSVGTFTVYTPTTGAGSFFEIFIENSDSDIIINGNGTTIDGSSTVTFDSNDEGRAIRYIYDGSSDWISNEYGTSLTSDQLKAIQYSSSPSLTNPFATQNEVDILNNSNTPINYGYLLNRKWNILNISSGVYYSPIGEGTDTDYFYAYCIESGISITSQHYNINSEYVGGSTSDPFYPTIRRCYLFQWDSVESEWLVFYAGSPYTKNQHLAITGASSPSSTNVFATMNDVGTSTMESISAAGDLVKYKWNRITGTGYTLTIPETNQAGDYLYIQNDGGPTITIEATGTTFYLYYVGGTTSSTFTPDIAGTYLLIYKAETLSYHVMDMERSMGNDFYQAIIGASSPSSTNVFATMDDVDDVADDVTTLTTLMSAFVYRESVSAPTGTWTINFNSAYNYRIQSFVDISSSQTLSFSNALNGSVAIIPFSISNYATTTLSMPDGEVHMSSSDSRWNSTTGVWTPTADGDYKMEIYYGSGYYLIEISDTLTIYST